MTRVPEHSPGAQSVLLAWRRTALEIGIVSIVGARYLAEQLNPWIALVGVAGVVLALVLHAGANRVYRDGVDTSRGIAFRHGALIGFAGLLGVAALALVVSL